MSENCLLVHNALLVNEGRVVRGWLLVRDAYIEAIGEGDPGPQLADVNQRHDAHGAWLLPGAIDEHVHFREPGLTHKADIGSESRAAVAGGVTSFIDMPNTRPLTITVDAVEAKLARAEETSVANYGFFIGATNDNLDELLSADYSRIAGVKLFLGSSTGNMLVDDSATLRRLLSEVKAPIAVHAESESRISSRRSEALARHGNPDDLPLELHSDIRDAEACYEASSAIVAMARETGARLHLLHVSTARELSLLDPGPVGAKRITAETCPQYLMFCRDDYSRLGARIKCNPAVKDAADREALRQALRDGRIDCIGSDHAPHLLQEKEGGALKAVSGMPMLQFTLPLMMDMLEPAEVAALTAHNPATVFGIDRRGFLRPGYYADLVMVECLERPRPIGDADVLSRCGWTPLAGMSLGHRVASTWVNGLRVWDGFRVSDSSSALPLGFGFVGA